jgi:hypothetical protein
LLVGVSQFEKPYSIRLADLSVRIQTEDLLNISLVVAPTSKFYAITPYCKKVKQSRYTPWRRLGGEEIQLLLILDLDTRWG